MPIFRRAARLRHLLSLLCALLATPILPPPHAGAATEFSPRAKLRYFETAHFRIIYDDPSIDEFAADLAAMAEEVRREVHEGLGMQGPPRVDVLLLDNYDYSNGSAAGYPVNVMRLFLTVPAPPVSGSSDISDSMGESWLRELLTHEYTHVVQLNRFTGWTRAWKWVFHANPFHLIYPGWFIEGLAVAAETDLSTRGRARTSASDMFLRAAMLEDRFLPVGQWGNMTGWPRGGARYLYGGSFLYYVRQRFGKDSLRRIVDACNAQLPFLDDLRLTGLADFLGDLGFKTERMRRARAGGLERGFQKATGVPLSTLLADWKRSLAQRYALEAHLVREAGASLTTPLTRLGGNTRSPAVSPDGSRVAYIASPDSGRPGLEVLPVAGGKRRHLLDRNDITGNLAWSPDGTRLVYARMYDYDQPLARALSRADLFAFDLKSGKERRLTEGLRVSDPAFAPDGRFLVAVAGGGGRTRLLRLEADGNGAREILTPDSRGVREILAPDRTWQLSTPVISPDGRRIAMSVFVQQDPPQRGRYYIGLVNVDGSDFQLLEGPGVNREPAWIDADRIVFSSDRTGIFNLYTVDLRDRQVRPLTNVLTGAFQPQVARGERLEVVFRGYSARGFDLHRLEASSAEWDALRGGGPGRVVPMLLENGVPAYTVDPPVPASDGGGGAGTLPGSGGAAREVRTVEESTAPAVREPAAASTIVPLPEREAPKTRRYHPPIGLRLTRLRPFIGIDEGASSDGYPSGLALGVAASISEPLGRHDLYADVAVGLSSGRPTWTAIYTNRALAFPVQIHGLETVSAIGQEEDGSLTWERSRGGGLSLGLPFARGAFSASLSLGGSLRQEHDFSAIDPDGTTRLMLRRDAQLSLGYGFGNAWRSPSRGHFLGLEAGQESEVGGVSGAGAGRQELTGRYVGRTWVGRGVVDLELAAGIRQGSDYEFVVGGWQGPWSLPGITYGNGIAGSRVGLAQLSITQDLWRPELALGQVPWFYLERVELILSAGAAAGIRDGEGFAEGRYGQAVSGAIRAQLFTLRSYLSFAPEVGAGVDLRTGAVTWWVTLDAWPALYRQLLPFRVP